MPHPSSSSGLGQFATALAFLAAAFELLATPIQWLFFHAQTLDMLLQQHSHSMPMLLSGPHVPSTLAQTLIFLLDLLPASLTSLAFGLAALFFRNLAKGEAWSTRNTRMIWLVGTLCICLPLIHMTTVALQSLALGLDLPSAERGLDLFVDLSGFTLSQIVLGLLLCSFSRLIKQAKSLSDEQSMFV